MQIADFGVSGWLASSGGDLSRQVWCFSRRSTLMNCRSHLYERGMCNTTQISVVQMCITDVAKEFFSNFV